jgi:hypothetical protein
VTYYVELGDGTIYKSQSYLGFNEMYVEKKYIPIIGLYKSRGDALVKMVQICEDRYDFVTVDKDTALCIILRAKETPL